MNARLVRTAALSLLIASCSALSPAHAAGTEVTTGYLSYHINSDREFNERNYGIGIEVPTGYRESLRAGAGVYRNSLDRTSVYVGAAWRPLVAGPVSAGVIVGAATGYAYAVIPVVGISVQVNVGERAALHAVATPPAPETPAVVALQAKWRF